LDSILSQKGLSIEVILINDGSTDGSETIAADYAQNDVRIVLYNQAQKGIPYARNKGLELASGEYVLFIDADDYIASDALYRLYHKACDNELDILQTEIYKVSNSGKITRWRQFPVQQVMSGVAYFQQMIHKRSMRVSPYFNVVKRTFLQKTGLQFDERLQRCQDFDFFTKLMIKANRIMNIPFPYYYFRVNSNTFVRQDRHNIQSLFQYYHLIIDNFKQFTQDEHLDDQLLNKLMWFVCSHTSSYNTTRLKVLTSEEKIYWNAFIRNNIFKNQGWLRPRSYIRYLKTYKN
jgi:glycosyltransferase involved in cell wall biosynthesis